MLTRRIETPNAYIRQDFETRSCGLPINLR
jgi:hypothetical protein